MLLGGPVTVSDPDPAVNDIPTRRWSMSKAWVEEPGRTSTAWEIVAASGVETENCPLHAMLAGVLPMVGRVAEIRLLLPSRVNRYAGW